MYIFKNAIRNVFRSKDRSILIGIILFVLMFSACISGNSQIKIEKVHNLYVVMSILDFFILSICLTYHH